MDYVEDLRTKAKNNKDLKNENKRLKKELR